MEAPKHPLIHVAKYFNPKKTFLLLRKEGSSLFSWSFLKEDFSEVPAELSASTPEEALRLAYRKWHHLSFSTLMCGFRYTLPERDEHGINAFFHQMVASLSSMNGVYFDGEFGYNCFVQAASQEAQAFWRLLEQKKVPLK